MSWRESLLRRAQVSARPNILFVQSDQQRPDWVEMNAEIPVRTPHLRDLAERGRWFSHAVCPSPLSTSFGSIEAKSSASYTDFWSKRILYRSK